MLTRFDFVPLMQKRFAWLFINACIALLIYSNAECGRLMGLKIQPVQISIVWPATGVALAALLLYGVKAWPGVLAGNLLYNGLHFYTGSQSVYIPILIALTISLGSLVQALTSACIMRNYSSRGYFNNVKDMLVFLIPAGALSCLIAPTIGVTALYLYGAVQYGDYLSSWIVFWVGDTMGVYILTPLIVVWSLYKARASFAQTSGEVGLMFVLFVLLSWLNFWLGYSLKFLYIPFILWVTYRFLLHGATVFVGLIFLSTLMWAFRSHALFSDPIVGNQLFILVLFLDVLVATALVFAGIIREREAVVLVLQRQNIDLRQSVELHAKGLKAVDHETSVQGTLGSLSFLTSHIARQLQTPLKALGNLTSGCQACLSRLKKEILPHASKAVKEDVQVLDDYLKNMIQFDDQANSLAHLVQEQSALSALGRMKIEMIALHDLLDESLDKVISDDRSQYPDFTFTLVKNYDSRITMAFPLPEDLTPAFIPIFNASLHSLRLKQARYLESYVPKLEIATKEYSDKVEVIIRDNGAGVPSGDGKKLFHSFMSFTPQVGTESLSLSLAHDLIVYVHRGTINVDSIEGDFTQITVVLPKVK